MVKVVIPFALPLINFLSEHATFFRFLFRFFF